jgi:DNA-binding transcriptional regulator YhcF (GntR family)
MEIRLDNGKSLPVYRRIVEAIRHQVATGQLLPGERLPTVRELAQDLQVDRNTALRAYRVLHREGVISLEHGRGTFVRANPRQAHLTQYRRYALENMMDESIARALSLNYTPEELERAFQKRLTNWRRARRTAREE